MNKNEFFEIIETPAKLKNYTAEEIEEIIQEYSYFQIPYLLKSKLLFDNHSFKYDNFLKISSVFVNDRAKLYHFVNNPLDILNESENVETKQEIKQETKQKEIIKEENEHINTEKENNTDIAKEVVKEEEKETKRHLTKEINLNKSKSTQTESNKINKGKQTEKVEKTTSIADEILKKYQPKQAEKESIADIILRKAAEAKRQKQLSKEEKQEEKHTAIKQNNLTGDKQKYKDINVKQKAEILNKDRLEPEIEKAKELKEQEQTDEFDILKEIEAIDDNTEIFDLSYFNQPQEEPKDLSSLSFEEWLDYVENKTTKKETSEIKKQESLIEKFIKNKSSNKISSKGDTQQIASVVNKGTEEKDDLITETLANIYIKQKLYDKAIKAFTKLSLKYPEKSVYFANRIEEINKLIKKE